MHLRVGIVMAISLAAALGWVATAQDPVDVVLERAERASELEASDAVILLDAGRTSVDSDGRVEYMLHVQILLLTWEAIDGYGQVEVPYSEDLLDFELLYGRTILPSGEVVELEEAGIRISSRAEGGGEEAYSELKTVTLSMPSLRPGAVIDYAYTLVEESPVIEGEFFDQWLFEWYEPVQRSEYVLDVPQGKDFGWVVSGRVLEPEIQSSSGRVVYTFRAEEIEAIEYEVDMPSPLAIGSYVTASSVGSWDDVAAWWWGLVRDKLARTDELTSLAAELTAAAVTDEERTSQLFDFVAREVRYVSLHLSASGYEPRPVEDTLATRYGDCKDQAVLLVSLLNSAGIEAYPVLIGTEPGYRLDWSTPPAPIPFDHAIVAVPSGKGGWRFLDPTCSFCTSDFTDEAIRDLPALLVSEHPAVLGAQVHTDAPLASESMVRCELTGMLDGEDLLSLHAETTTSGDYDIAYRSILTYYRPSGRSDLFALFADLSVSQSSLVDYEHSDLDDNHSPVTLQIDLKKERAVRWISGGIGLMVLPYGPAFPFVHDFAEAVVSAERAYPLLTLVSQVEHAGRIDVGAHVIRELPEAVSVMNDVGRFHSEYSVEGTEIVYERVLRIDVAEVPP
jgi:transglutaminase-like putative cysteine protease